MFDTEQVFPSKESLGDRPWGQEELLALVSQKFSVKRLVMRKGSMGGLQYHRLKDEVAVVISGQLLVRFDLGDGNLLERVLGPGSVAHFPPGLVHQEEALTDCELLEASSPHFNDRVRVEEEYGRGLPVGLPTTAVNEIELK